MNKFVVDVLKHLSLLSMHTLTMFEKSKTYFVTLFLLSQNFQMENRKYFYASRILRNR